MRKHLHEISSQSGKLIAPCGINCSLCLAFLREKNRCNGCGSSGINKKYCSVCYFNTCELRRSAGGKYCFECSKFPCTKLKKLDKRYRTRYKVSNIENLEIIRDSGLEHFLKLEKEKWTCTVCGGNICMHRGVCLKCEKEKTKHSSN